MGRKLTKSEKRLIILLTGAVLGCVFYFVFWNGITKKIEDCNFEISVVQVQYNDYQSKVNQIEDLKRQLEDVLKQPSHKDKFYTADENQEVYMDFLHNLITDNDLRLESIVFSTDRVELPVVTPITDNRGDPPAITAPRTTPSTPMQSYFNVTTAVTSFNIDFNTPEKLLSVLDTIEQSEKMVLIGSLQLNTGQAAGNTQNAGSRIEAGASNKEYKCVAVIKFVKLVTPPEKALKSPDDGQASSDSQENSSASFEVKPTPMSEDPNEVYEITVDTDQD